MALENNLGIRADRLGPQIQTYAVAEARAAYGLNLRSTTLTRSATAPPTDFLTSGADNSILSSDNFSTGAGIEQLVPWGGGRYTLGIDASRFKSNNPTNPFNPQLDSSLTASYTQPLLRNFRMDSFRQNLLAESEESGDRRRPAAADADADLEPRAQLVLQPGQRDRTAAGRAEVARAGADVSQEQSEEG